MELHNLRVSNRLWSKATRCRENSAQDGKTSLQLYVTPGRGCSGLVGFSNETITLKIVICKLS